MSFFLNGLGEEIDMGLAFTSLDISGGLYPCASFNRGEVIQFNFGSTPFAFSPPEGYLPYSHHVQASMNANRDYHMSLPKHLRSLVSFSSSSKQWAGQEAKRASLSALERAQMALDSETFSQTESPNMFFFENSLEEIKGKCKRNLYFRTSHSCHFLS